MCYYENMGEKKPISLSLLLFKPKISHINQNCENLGLLIQKHIT